MTSSNIIAVHNCLMCGNRMTRFDGWEKVVPPVCERCAQREAVVHPGWTTEAITWDEITEDELMSRIDEESQRRLGMSGGEFVEQRMAGTLEPSLAESEIGVLVSCLSDEFKKSPRIRTWSSSNSVPIKAYNGSYK